MARGSLTLSKVFVNLPVTKPENFLNRPDRNQNQYFNSFRYEYRVQIQNNQKLSTVRGIDKDMVGG